MIRPYCLILPRVDPSAFVDPSAEVIGNTANPGRDFTP
jgi:carbonic anhydrase/acetyltransferase-like protein (isoleucine patch superfamily)